MSKEKSKSKGMVSLRALTDKNTVFSVFYGSKNQKNSFITFQLGVWIWMHGARNISLSYICFKKSFFNLESFLYKSKEGQSFSIIISLTLQICYWIICFF